MNIFFILALIVFVVAAIPYAWPSKLNLIAIGLALLTAGFLWPNASLN